MVAEIDLGIDELSDFQVIGRGGFSTIYSAYDGGFNRRVAVKLLHSLDDSGRRRFDRERGIMGQLSSHPNVIMPFRAGYARTGAPYLVMELVTGGSLQDLIDTRGGQPWHEAVELVLPVTAALGHAHEQGILHRDVKPANIVLTGRIPKLTDFGIAAIRESTTTQVAYTLAHCPPEAFASGADTRDDRSDLYSMASTLYNLVTGRPPYHLEGTDSPQAYMYRIMEHAIPPIPDSMARPALQAFSTGRWPGNPAERAESARESEAEPRYVLAQVLGTTGPVTYLGPGRLDLRPAAAPGVDRHRDRRPPASGALGQRALAAVAVPWAGTHPPHDDWTLTLRPRTRLDPDLGPTVPPLAGAPASGPGGLEPGGTDCGLAPGLGPDLPSSGDSADEVPAPALPRTSDPDLGPWQRSPATGQRGPRRRYVWAGQPRPYIVGPRPARRCNVRPAMSGLVRRAGTGPLRAGRTP